MADDINVVLTVTERGLDTVQRDVEALRSELQGLGIDMRDVERRLNGIESSSNKVGRSVREYARNTREAAKANEENARSTKKASDAVDEQGKKVEQTNGSLISARYALYDVANALTRTGTVLAGVGIYVTTVGAQFETAFTNVERTFARGTTATQIDTIRNSLIQLSGQIPLTFAEISQVATLGNQLGLEADEIVGFTETVARFASVSGLTIDAVTQAFGGFLAQTGLGAEYLENLGSSIALVGINSNATEAQIISLVREIAATTSQAGFAVDEIVGLAGALASFQIAPERARGVLDTYFATLNKAVAEGGDRLTLFANVAGRSREELEQLVRAGEGGTVFRSVLQGLEDFTADGVELTQVLDALGLSGLRASNTVGRFIGRLEVANQSFADAYEGFVEGEELTRQYGYTLDDLSTQFTIFINGLNALAEAVSGGAVESLADLFQVVNQVVFAFTEFLDANQWVADIGGLTIAFVIVTGAVLTFRGLLLAGTAATYAMRTAIQQMGGSSLAAAGTVRGLAGSLLGLTGAASRGAAAMRLFSFAVRTIPLIGLVALGSQVISSFVGQSDAATNATHAINNYDEIMNDLKRNTSDGTEATNGLADSLGGAGKAAAEAADPIRLLSDYVSDLTGVFQRSGNLRFGQEDAFDEITLAWIKLNEESEKYERQIRTLTADRRLQEYFLKIAEQYEDQVRASELRENIAKIDDELAEAQAGASTELTGNTRAAIENRKVFRDLLGSYEDYVTALADAGASQEQIQAVVSQLNTDFNAQATALGFSGAEVQRYSTRFEDFARIVATIPPNIDLAFNPDPVQQALNEFFAKAEDDARRAGQSAGDGFRDGFGDGIGGGGGGGFSDDLFAPVYDGGVDLAPDYGKSAGEIWFQDFVDALGRGDINAAIDMLFQDSLEGWKIGFGELGDEIENVADGFTTYWDEQFNEIGQLFSDPGGFLPKWFDEQVKEVQTLFDTLPGDFQSRLDKIEPIFGDSGKSSGDQFNGGLNAALGASNAIQDFINRQDGYGNGRNLGSAIGGGLSDALSNSLRGKTIKANTGGGLGGALGLAFGFSGGGYTGAGHWLQPAGVVHKGEYVVPKKHVDQRTGLPSVNYVQSLQRGKSAPKAGYATGGYVNSGMPRSIELGSSTIGAIAGALSVRLSVGRERLASTVSQGDSRLAWKGSN